MIKREFKYNFKSFLAWLIITISVFLLVYLVYPTIIKGENIDMINQMMEMFPLEVLKAFNMDVASLDSAYGWIKSEGFIFILLIISSYGAILGSNILLKEENDKTIEYLNSLPIKRKSIVLSRIIVGITYLLVFVFALGVFNFIALLFSGDFDKLQFVLLSITPIFPSFVTFFLCMFISTFTHKSKKMLGIGLGIVLVSYILNAISSMSSSVEFVKYLSIFTLANTRNVIINNEINFTVIIISTCISLLFAFLIINRYNKKELV